MTTAAVNVGELHEEKMRPWESAVALFDVQSNEAVMQREKL